MEKQMDRLHDVARLLISCLAIAGDEAKKQIPTSHGILDRAIRDAFDRFPGWAQNEIHIVDSRVGWRCVELPTILGWAQAAELTSAPNPYYRVTELQVSPRVAKILLERLGVSEEAALALGHALIDGLRTNEREAVEAAVSS
jgi:hypothetical protein